MKRIKAPRAITELRERRGRWKEARSKPNSRSVQLIISCALVNGTDGWKEGSDVEKPLILYVCAYLANTGHPTYLLKNGVYSVTDLLRKYSCHEGSILYSKSYSFVSLRILKNSCIISKLHLSRYQLYKP